MILAKKESSLDVLRDFVLNLTRILFTLFSVLYLPGMILYLVLRLVLRDRFWLLAFFNNFSPLLFLPLIIIIPGALILRWRWLLIAAVPLAIVGIAWVAPYYWPRAAAAPAQQPIRLVTLNVWQGNSELNTSADWLRETKADIVVLQEVLDDDEHRGALLRLNDVYPHQHTEFLTGALWGNVTLSRYPILSVETLENERGDTFTSQQRFELDINGQTVALYNVHFARPITPDEKPRIQLPLRSYLFTAPLTYDDSLRNQQIRTFLDWLGEETLPYIVAGDLNMSDQSFMYGEVAARMSDSFREVGRGLGLTWPVARAEKRLPSFLPPLMRIDYVLHSPQFRAVEVTIGPDWLGADHVPLLATLDFVTNGA